jgi:SHS2 domain-containing protein
VGRHSRIELQSDNREELFVNWLSELLSLAYAEEVVISSIKMERFADDYLFADVVGEDFKNYKFKTEIKAVTYHHLHISQLPQTSPQMPGGWQAEVIFDV